MTNTESNKRAAVFVDRDGTLIEEVDFLARVDDLRLFHFTAPAIERLKANDFLVIVVTNQSGIGRRRFDEAAMHAIHDEMQKRLDGLIDAFTSVRTFRMKDAVAASPGPE
jgi:D-glycero-D-manno-heptose 1,7-bisphosphate phosphatase